MSSPARRRELEALREEAARQERLELIRVANLSIYEHMSEATTLADMKSVIEMVC
ncbi:hypothetical protein [Sinorhizobium medicae]